MPFGFRKKKKQEPQAATAAAATTDENSYDPWIDDSKLTETTNPPVDESTYDNWEDDAAETTSPSVQVEDHYDDWSASDHHMQKTGQSSLPPVEDLYDDFKNAGDQEYEEVEEGDIFGFDNKAGSPKHTATSPSWVKPPPVKGTPPSTRKMTSVQPSQDVGDQEYEDVTGEGDIFGFDNKRGSFTNTTSPSWANKAPVVKGTPPSTRRPISMQQQQRPPDLPKSLPPSERPKSVQSPTYTNVQNAAQSKYGNVQSSNYMNVNTAATAAPYEMPQDQSYMNVNQQEAGDSYEEMEDLNIQPNYVNVTSQQPSYVNVTSQDVGGESYEVMDDLDIKKSSPPAENGEFYEDVQPDNRIKKPPITAGIAERQQQLQKKETKEPPKKRGLAADYQKMKFEMLAQKFKDIDAGETKPEPTKTLSDKKGSWPPPKAGANDGVTPEKGTVTTLTKNFQLSGGNKAKDKVNMKGLLWHKAPGRTKYHEEHCELEGNNLKLFRNKNDPSPYFTINTTQCELAAAPEEYEKRNVFKLTAGASRDYFGAFNAGEMKAWMNALKPVVKTAK